MSDRPPLVAPTAERRPVTTVLHAETRTDDYSWLRVKSDPAVIAHLEAENEFTAAVMQRLQPLKDLLFEEMRARILETDLSVPTTKGPYAYFSRTAEGSQYAIHCRRPAIVAYDAQAQTEQLLLDENKLAEGHDFFALGTFEVSPDHRLLAYAFDREGDEVYALRVRDLATGRDLEEVITGTAAGVAWSADASTLFYTVLDDAMRPWQLYRHVLGTSPGTDVLVHQETDERFYSGVSMSTTDELIVLTIGSQVTTEIHILRADDPAGAFRCVATRRQDIEYSVDHHRSVDGSERLFIITNDGALNFRLCVAPVDSSDPASWHAAAPEWEPDAEIGGASSTRPKLDAIDVFRSHLVLYERADGLERIRVIELDELGGLGEERVLAHDEPVHSVWGLGNAEFDSTSVRFGYTSLTTPTTIYDEDLRTAERTMRKRQPVLGPFDPTDYVSTREWAVAGDGARIPISVVRRRDTPLDGTAPGLLYGYGSYEISIDPTFSSLRLSLLDRGLVFAIAHIRGGGEMGRQWYLDGKFLNKRNTFTDFIACAEHLVQSKVVDSRRLVARGGSAGGLLMGAVSNLRPDLFAAIVAEVPFVDVVNTMLDDTLPLTAIEGEEWGNPADPEFFAYMQSYSPYENVRRAPYPRILVTAGLNDPRVSYWEPAKWVQRLRASTTSGREILLKTEMGAGHGGPSGRYDAWRDEAFVQSFILDTVEAHTAR